jgi:hypothetical protein
MFIVWRGFGWAVPVIVIAAFILMQLSVNTILGEGYYSSNEWPKTASILIGAALVGLLGYFLNYQKRTVVVDEETGEKHKSSSHALFFIPIEIWAIIIPVVFFWAQHSNAEQHAKEIALIQSPAVNDKYSVDFTEIFEGADNEYKYGVMKVMQVTPGGVEVRISDIAYNKKSGVRSDIMEGKADDDGYYSSNTAAFSHAELAHYHEGEAIYKVSRE